MQSFIQICQGLLFTGTQNMDMTGERISSAFDLKGLLLSLKISFIPVRAAVPCAILDLTF